MNIMKLNKNWKLKIVKKMKVCLKFRDQLFQWIVLFYRDQNRQQVNNRDLTMTWTILLVCFCYFIFVMPMSVLNMVDPNARHVDLLLVRMIMSMRLQGLQTCVQGSNYWTNKFKATHLIENWNFSILIIVFVQLISVHIEK